MKTTFCISLIGKTVAKISRLKGGHGSALPGLVVEKLSPHFLARALKSLPLGVAVISGTNGKTTTTKMVAEILEQNGLQVLTNDSGSNFTRGVASSVVTKMKRGKLNYDIAVLELDEAHAVHFVHEIAPDYSLLLNVFRDQLDRFGEIDNTTKLLTKIAQKTLRRIVLNKDDPHIANFQNEVRIPAMWFGFADNLRPVFPTDEQLHTNGKKAIKQPGRLQDEILLVNFSNGQSTYEFHGKKVLQTLMAGGAHNALNGAAALQLVRAILEDRRPKDKFDFVYNVELLSRVKPAFGRGESFKLSGRTINLNLVKNPAGFRLSLGSADTTLSTAIFINDAYADGRDVSWLYDIDFSSLRGNEGLYVGGVRAYDMALRLYYDNVKYTKIMPGISECLMDFLQDNSSQDLQIYSLFRKMRFRLMNP